MDLEEIKAGELSSLLGVEVDLVERAGAQGLVEDVVEPGQAL